MDIVRTGLGVRKTFSNVARAREIIAVFWRNGFAEMISKTGVHKLLPGFVIPKVKIENYKATKDQDFWGSIGYRLRQSFEELGPSFIKLGQLISSREDLLDPSLIAQLKLLQNGAGVVDFEIIKKKVEKSLGKPIDEIFDSFNKKPLGTASIGLVYEAKLKTGEQVVVKVRRPGIGKIIRTDFEIISFLVSQIEKVSDDFKYLGVSRAIEDFFLSINLELNFLFEAQNCEKLKKNLAKVDKEKLFVLPQIYEEYTKEDIIVMSKLNGVAFNTLGNVTDNEKLVNDMTTSVRYFIHTLLVDGFFHADLHGGNFFLLDDQRIGLIDFGLMGNLSKKNRENLVAILYSLVTNNYENLVYEFLDVADFENIPDVDELIKDIEATLAPFVGLGAQDIDITLMVNSIVTTLSKHQMYLPRKWFIIFRALMTLDGVGKSLGLNVNIFESIESEISKIMKELISKDAVINEALWIGRDSINTLRVVPRHIKWLLREFSKKKYTLDVELVGVEKQLEHTAKNIYSLGYFVLTGVFVFCGAMFSQGHEIAHFSDIPIMSLVMWALALISFLRK